MKKNLGVVPAVYPMPVLMVAAYDEAGTVNVMNAAWGMICAMDKIALFIDGNKMPDKFARTGYHAAKSTFVNAPVVEEFPVVMECELNDVVSNDSFYCIVGKIVNVAAEEKVLAPNGKVSPAKLNALIFDQFQNGYYVTGEQAGRAWHAGANLMKK